MSVWDAVIVVVGVVPPPLRMRVRVVVVVGERRDVRASTVRRRLMSLSGVLPGAVGGGGA